MADEETVIDANESGIMDDRAEISSIPDSSTSNPDYSKGEEPTIDEPEVDGGETGEAQGENAEEGNDEGQETRFDKHPDWQRMKTERNEAREKAIRLEAQLELLKSQGAKPTEDKPAAKEPPTYKDINDMSEDELREWQEDDPKGYAANLLAMVTAKAQEVVDTRTEAEKRAEEERQSMTRIEATFKDYADKNPDFSDMWNSGDIQKFMDDHPGHNAISAHQMMTYEKRIAEAKEQAAKEAEERVINNFKAKRNAGVLSEGPSHRGGSDGTPAELKNTKAHGGLYSALARLSEARRNK